MLSNRNIALGYTKIYFYGPHSRIIHQNRMSEQCAWIICSNHAPESCAGTMCLNYAFEPYSRIIYKDTPPFYVAAYLKIRGYKENLYIIQQPNIGVEGFLILIGKLFQKRIMQRGVFAPIIVCGDDIRKGYRCNLFIHLFSSIV